MDDRYTPSHALFLASNTLNDIAFNAARASKTDQDTNLVAILFSAAWFEGSVNEVIYELVETDLGDDSKHLKPIKLAARAAAIGERSVPMERKLKVLCAAATGGLLDETLATWRDVLLLFRLRNWTVHLRPERLKVRAGTEDEPSSLVSTHVHDLVADLLAAGAIAEIPAGQMVPVALATRLSGVGSWAYRAGYAGLEAVDTWFPERHWKLAQPHRAPNRLEAAV
jgi:hypothetical protein